MSSKQESRGSYPSPAFSLSLFFLFYFIQQSTLHHSASVQDELLPMRLENQGKTRLCSRGRPPDNSGDQHHGWIQFKTKNLEFRFIFSDDSFTSLIFCSFNFYRSIIRSLKRFQGREHTVPQRVPDLDTMHHSFILQWWQPAVQCLAQGHFDMHSTGWQESNPWPPDLQQGGRANIKIMNITNYKCV